MAGSSLSREGQPPRYEAPTFSTSHPEKPNQMYAKVVTNGVAEEFPVDPVPRLKWLYAGYDRGGRRYVFPRWMVNSKNSA